ncbi:MAG: hypothetical protein OXC29_19510 [Rhodococcus sp.]|nr:hypothetical protein [Rhodococcus sp. (in: high G+C Gram-positive bacteria)]
MEILGLRQDIPRDPVAQVLTYEGRSVAFVDLGRHASEALRASWSTDRPFQSGGVIDSAWLLPMVGVGSPAASALFAGNVFLATANPQTLMTIGAGVGSAVMGPTGIVATAPFVAASGALIPVVAPMMLFATVSSVTMSARLDRVQRTLGRLFDVVEAVRRHLDAEDYARLETAVEQIDAIRSEFEHCQRFAGDVPDRLSRVEERVSLLRTKYGLLMTRGVHSEDDARSAVSDLNRFFLASLCDLHVDLLQLYLALQNDEAAVVEFRRTRLWEKIERYSKDFRRILDDDRVGAFHRKLKGDLAESRWRYLPRRLRHPFGGELATTVRNVRAIRRDFDSVQTRIKRWIEAFEVATDEWREQSIVFYREPDGERALRAYHTRDVRLERAAT